MILKYTHFPPLKVAFWESVEPAHFSSTRVGSRRCRGGGPDPRGGSGRVGAHTEQAVKTTLC